VDPNADPVRDANAIVGELVKFSEDLKDKPRWLVLNKSDLLPPEEALARAQQIAKDLRYRGPAFLISGATHTATRELCDAVMRFLETGEAPARGNIDVPVFEEAKAPRMKKAAPVRKPAAKAKAKPKPKPKVKAKPNAKAKAKTKPKVKQKAKAAPKRVVRKPAKAARKK
jgi:outer membrane biosynthesis protein TonB